MKRTVNFKVSADGAITPALPQYAGVRGEHNTAEVVFDVSAWNGEPFVYRAEFVDGCGSGDTTEVLTKDASGRITVPLPRAWTNAGGQAVLRLVASVMDGAEEAQTVFVVDAPLQFSDKQNATGQIGDAGEKGLTQLIMETREAQENAQAVADEIQRMAEEGAFDGKDGAPGGKGDPGPQGLPGTDGKNGADGYGLLPFGEVTYNLGMDGIPASYTVNLGEEYEELPPRWMLSVMLARGTGENTRLIIRGKNVLFSESIGWCGAEAGRALFTYDGNMLGYIAGAKGDKGESITVESIEESTEDGGENVVTFSDGNVLHVKNGEKGDLGTSVQQTLLYENADGLSQTYGGKITVANPKDYDYFVVVTDKGTFPVYQCEKLSNYVSGGTLTALGGGGFYLVSVCFGTGTGTDDKWWPYELGCFYISTFTSPTWPTTMSSLKVYKIIGVKTAALLPTWNGGAY